MIKTYVPVATYPAKTDTCVTRVRFPPERSSKLAVCMESGGIMRLIDLPSQRALNIQYNTSDYLHGIGLENYLSDFAFNRTGELIFVVSSDGRVSLTPVNMFGTHLPSKRSHMHAIDITHDGVALTLCPNDVYDFIIYTGGGDGIVKQWDLRLASPKPKFFSALTIQESEDSNPIVEGWSEPMSSVWAHNAAVSSIAICGNSIFTSGVDDNVRVWDCDFWNAQETVASTAHTLGIWDMCFNKKLNSMIVLGGQGEIWKFPARVPDGAESFRCRNIECIWDAPAEEYRASFFDKWKRFCTFGHYAAIPLIEGGCSIVNLLNGDVTGEFDVEMDHDDPIACVDVHPNEQMELFITGSISGSCTLWCRNLW
ncbi:bifunctional WD40 repeat/WD40-YVTN repeat-like-containing domain superfamily/WD40-repeat-containing domain superfamily [Babesia duncani]|uniref:Bifunctional WD40 repeat/WD40-YVTN repeat-like-containing domain superfamily/WD40-repeat-containing domain superfamily n=1 Tax=Babesia duncani TaxID=323732 RepID=A0AAD9PH67_9APIC|nr:bifunctional WD40 repeat/WD40-YVTN repeat-like-containing domain superfamily/WD40-repeat-containing domain superfamily [Babesia duncani]